MLPRDQGEGGDEENHRQIWSDREAAGEYELLRFAFCSLGSRAAAFSVALLISDSVMQYAAWHTTASKCFFYLCL